MLTRVVCVIPAGRIVYGLRNCSRRYCLARAIRGSMAASFVAVWLEMKLWL